jgi:hypothetical protein
MMMMMMMMMMTMMMMMMMMMPLLAGRGRKSASRLNQLAAPRRRITRFSGVPGDVAGRHRNRGGNRRDRAASDLVAPEPARTSSRGTSVVPSGASALASSVTN